MLVSEMQEKLAQKNKELLKLRADLRASREAYEQYAKKNAQLEKEGLTSSNELEALKKELFFSLAVAIKLNLALQGRRCNLSVMNLYERAVQERVHYSEWQEWIPAKFAEESVVEPLPFSATRSIAGSPSTSTSGSTSSSSSATSSSSSLSSTVASSTSSFFKKITTKKNSNRTNK